MSQLRKVKLQISKDVAEDVCRKMGWDYRANDVVHSYATQRAQIVADLVMAINGVEIGMRDGELIYDDMYEKEAMMFVSEYLSELFQRQGVQYEKVETDKKLVFIVY